MKIRNHGWYDPVNNRPMYSLQVRHEGKWKNVTLGGEFVLCDTEEERAKEHARLKELLEKSKQMKKQAPSI